VLGLVHGRGENEGKPAADLTYAKVRELMDRFAAECGSCVCRTILGGCNLLTEEGQKQFKEKNLHETTCVPCVATAVRIVESLL
jgi:hypothetical protein